MRLFIVFIALIFLGAACSNDQPRLVAIGGESTDPVPTVPLPTVTPETVPANATPTDTTSPSDTTGPTDSTDSSQSAVDEPVEDEHTPVEQAPPVDNTDLAEPVREDFCRAFFALEDVGTPGTPSEAEFMVATMRDDAGLLVDMAPPVLAAGAVEAARFLDVVTEMSEARGWDPAFFADMSEEDFSSTGLDMDLIERFFDDTGAVCSPFEIETIEEGPITTTE